MSFSFLVFLLKVIPRDPEIFLEIPKEREGAKKNWKNTKCGGGSEKKHHRLPPSPELQNPQNLYLEPSGALRFSFGAFRGFNTFIWSFPKLQTLHLKLFAAWTSSFGLFHSFKLFCLTVFGVSNLQLNTCSFKMLQDLYHESFVAFELTYAHLPQQAFLRNF